ncbi:fibronectin type III domain-containing protein [Actinorugispora endophytica]|uniref:DNA-binding beta-propeller fold protein YncE n=1 Tax=Actinorugispora endophytica TaxID=1605990 RepID=A0A4R6V3N4_9ACTN|nr:fibronectin type III domain-containing protein [Actinorugispora endophytica]TDQ54995.1 DNA-binding beta-propeller fold protein YncE [Actinorugispora endophytica]
MRQRVTAVYAAVRRAASAGTVVALTIALCCTLLGAGAISGAVRLADGNVWLWSSPAGQLSRTNPHDGRVDLVTNVPESAGHRVEVTQSDDHLILHDLDTGRMTSVDLGEMAFSGRLDLDADGDHSVFLDGDRGVVVDRRAGEVRAIDPATLTATGETLKLPAPLEGGAFAADGTLWIGVPSQGTVAGMRIADGTAKAGETVGVSDPADDIAVTVRDQGPLVVNRSDDTIVEVRDGATAEVESPVDLADAVVPERTSGALVAVTAPGADAILTLAGPHDGDGIAVVEADGIGSAAAVPYEGRVYLPAGDGGTLRVFDGDGGEAEPLVVPGAEGALDLEVREGHLFVNDPGSGSALVIGPSGEGVEVDKYEQPPGPGGTPTDEPAPGGGVDQGTGEPGTVGPSPQEPGQEEPSQEPDEEPGRVPPPPDVDPGTEPEEGVEPVLPEPTEPAPTTPPPLGGAQPPGGAAPVGSTTPGGTAALAPGAPVPVTASTGADEVTVTWQHAYSADAPVANYVVSWDDGSVTVGGGENSAVIGGLSDGASYRFQVQAVNAHGHGGAATSQTVVFGDQEPPPRPPTDVEAEATGTDSATLTWSPSPDAHDYVVSGEATDGSGVAARSTSDTAIDLAGLEPGKTYVLTVAARTPGGAQSAAAEAPAVTTPTLDPPQEVWFAFSDTGDAYVYWTPVEGAAGYEVAPEVPSLEPRHVAEAEPVYVGGKPFQSVVYGGAAPGCHSFTVRAVDAVGGGSGPSDPSSVKCAGRRAGDPGAAELQPTG